MAGTLFDCKVIGHEIRDKYAMVLELYQQEIEAVNDIFERTYREYKTFGLKVRLKHWDGYLCKELHHKQCITMQSYTDCLNVWKFLVNRNIVLAFTLSSHIMW